MTARSFTRPKSRWLVASILTVALMLPASLAAFAVPVGPTALPIIDHFDSAQGPLNAYLGAPVPSSVADANVLGGERDIVVTTKSSADASPPASSKVVVGSSLLSHSQDAGVVGQTLVTYDGVDGNPTTLNPTGLNNTDLTQGNADNGFSLTVRLNDLKAKIRITVYTSATSASQGVIDLPGGQAGGDPPITYYLEYAAFTQAPEVGIASPADFSNVGAITLEIDGFNGASDLTIEDFGITTFDWGDLPNNSVGGPNYKTTLADDGPRHVIGTLFMGASIDPFELNGIPSVPANGDDTSGQSDEDGVVPSAEWLPTSASVDVTVNGSGCLSAWVDWNKDGTLSNSELVIDNVAVDAGTTPHAFDPPVDPTNNSWYARFRLYERDAEGTCTTPRLPTGRAVNGEVEDYRWSSTPTAVTLWGATASTVPSPLAAILTVIPMVALAGGGVAFVRRRRS